MSLYLFDLDATLIEGFIETETCPTCAGDKRAREEDGSVMDAPCAPCRGTGLTFGESLPYDRVVWLPGRIEKLTELAKTPGVAFGIVTNQAGVAFGHQIEADVITKLAVVYAKLGDAGLWGVPLTTHVAYEHPKATVAGFKVETPTRRKPAPGMLFEAMAVHRTGPEETLFVGDMDSDAAAAAAAGVRFAWAEQFFEGV